MVGIYDPWLVVLSIVVAVIASYVALEFASRVAASQAADAAENWLTGGAISMGTGIWSMHFIGMLAFKLPIPMSYDIPITLLSLIIAGIVAWFALYTVSHGSLSLRRLLIGGLLMGAGVASMHYTGMAAMQMAPSINYDPPLFILYVPRHHLAGVGVRCKTGRSLGTLRGNGKASERRPGTADRRSFARE